MTENIHTATMAKLYMDQGHYDKAVGIYREILDQEPDREDIKDALADAEAKQTALQPNLEKQLGSLIGQWIELVIRYNRLQHLKKIKKKLS